MREAQTTMAAQMAMNTRGRRWIAVGAALLAAIAAIGCNQSNAPQRVAPVASPQATAIPDRRVEAPPRHDLSEDEAHGGHTLARHVGKTDSELRERLRREPDISSASTYTDRATAEAVIAAALSSTPRSFEGWRNRTGRRPNFVLHFAAHHAIGRSVARGRIESTPCENALVILRWDERRQEAYVLTSYPEERR
jgi:hypothetical protein